ncbi:MAG: formamidopyrimidine-DNA glycosylase [Planctomycetota bacterium]|jgi:formamidopyrimidine-DNA glycosylase
MPELPEVETVGRLIRPGLVGRTITGVSVDWVRSLGGLSKPRFTKAVVGARVKAVWRRGKYLVFDLKRGRQRAGCIVGHLRMTGRMHVESRNWDPGPHSRVRLDLNNGKAFHFIDVRKFGRLVWSEAPELVWPALGPEPLGPEFTAEWFQASLRSRKRQLKPLLLDQSFLAGLGNIYVDESLHKAGLHPLRSSDRVQAPAAARLHEAIRATLAEAIEREGSSFDTFYRTPEGQPGSYQDQFLVYGRHGKPCRKCGTKITRLVVGQRGTHVCTRCQPKPR